MADNMIIAITSASPKSESPLRRRVRSILRNPMAMIGLAIIVFWVLVAIFAPLISPYDPNAQKVEDRLEPPSAKYFFGTDENIFSGLMS
jgi:peptide/nickel transport system permease protein